MVNTTVMNQLAKYPLLTRYVSDLRNIPGGTYHWMSTTDPWWQKWFYKKEVSPLVTISAFRMGATPVTWGLWKEYCKSKSLRMPEKPRWGYLDNHPVVNVSWEDIMNPGGFCDWASNVARFKLSLPTDAQWEFAARGGQDGLNYPWGNDFDRSKLWCSKEKIVTVQSIDAGQTAAVDRLDQTYRNGYGLTDMVGNVNQWCADYYNHDYRPVGKDPKDTRRSLWYCVRGSSFFSYGPNGFRCADRYSSYKSRDRREVIGFRLAAGQK